MTVRKRRRADALVVRAIGGRPIGGRPIGGRPIGGRPIVRSGARTVAAAALAASLSTSCQELEPSPFDTPIRTAIVDLGASPYYPAAEDSRPTALSCYYFGDFMVKEYDLGGKGAEWLSILPTPGESGEPGEPGGPPACESAHERGEKLIAYPEWEGYFEGAKGSLVFLTAGDTVNGGLPFAIYDASNGTRIFEDSAYLESASFSRDLAVAATGEGYVLEYVRAAGASCDLHSEGTACWNRIEAEHSLPSDAMPHCTGYEHVSDFAGTDQVESMIAYAVEVTLSPRPAMRSVVSPVKCWPTH